MGEWLLRQKYLGLSSNKMEVATKEVFFQHDTSTEQIHIFLPTMTMITSILYSLILQSIPTTRRSLKIPFYIICHQVPYPILIEYHNEILG
jgi:hypothetical protein